MNLLKTKGGGGRRQPRDLPDYRGTGVNALAKIQPDLPAASPPSTCTRTVPPSACITFGSRWSTFTRSLKGCSL